MNQYLDDIVELRLMVDASSLPVDAASALESLARSLYIRFGAGVRGTSITYPRADEHVVVTKGASVDLQVSTGKTQNDPRAAFEQCKKSLTQLPPKQRCAILELQSGAPTDTRTQEKPR